MTARRITEARPVVPAVAGVTFCIDQSARADAVTALRALVPGFAT